MVPGGLLFGWIPATSNLWKIIKNLKRTNVAKYKGSGKNLNINNMLSHGTAFLNEKSQVYIFYFRKTYKTFAKFPRISSFFTWNYKVLVCYFIKKNSNTCFRVNLQIKFGIAILYNICQCDLYDVNKTKWFKLLPGFLRTKWSTIKSLGCFCHWSHSLFLSIRF